MKIILKSLLFRIFILVVVFANFCYLKLIQNDLELNYENISIDNSFEDTNSDRRDKEIQIVPDVQNDHQETDNLSTVENIFNTFFVDNVDPCEDFYTFVCKKWRKSYKESKIVNKKYYFNEFKEKFQEDLENKSKVIRMVKQMNDNCETVEYRKETCKNEVHNFSIYAYVSLYIKYLTLDKNYNQSIYILNEMIKSITREYKLLMEDKDFLDKGTKKNYLKKLEYMKHDFGHFENLADTQLMENCYSYFNFSIDDGVDGMLYKIKNYEYFIPNHLRWKCTRYIKFKQSYNEFEFLKLVGINAHYFFPKNTFTINLPFLNYPYFDVKFPMALNYGSIGFIIGHEITHAFDNDGIEIDYSGKKNKSIINKDSLKNYDEKANCFVQQYGNEIDKNSRMKINGRRTLDENMADNGGLKVAYRALMKHLYIKGRESEEIMYKNLTSEQLFFISYGITFCDKNNDKENQILGTSEKYYFTTKDISNILSVFSSYSPNDVRLKVTLSNYKPFAKAFNCKIGTKMNPKDKCEVWK